MPPSKKSKKSKKASKSGWTGFRLEKPPSQPFVHAICGRRFSHSLDVYRHHRRCWMAAGQPDVKWDAHPTCAHPGRLARNRTGQPRLRGRFVRRMAGRAKDLRLVPRCVDGTGCVKLGPKTVLVLEFGRNGRLRTSGTPVVEVPPPEVTPVEEIRV